MSVAGLMAAIALAFPTPSPAPRVHIGWCPERPMASCYEPGTNEVWYDGTSGVFVLRHEKCHAYDWQDVAPGERRAIAAAMRWRVWHVEPFADFCSGCSLGLDPESTTFQAQRIFHGVDPRRVPGICRLIARAHGPGETRS